MDIISAFKSGKRCRPVNGTVAYFLASEFKSIPAKLILDEWELEPEPEKSVTITRAQLEAAIRDCTDPCSKYSGELAKRLGL